MQEAQAAKHTRYTLTLKVLFGGHAEAMSHTWYNLQDAMHVQLLLDRVIHGCMLSLPTPHVQACACAGERGPESSRARKQKRKAVTEPSTEEELEPTEVEEEEAKAAALARMKGKKKARIQD